MPQPMLPWYKMFERQTVSAEESGGTEAEMVELQRYRRAAGAGHEPATDGSEAAACPPARVCVVCC